MIFITKISLKLTYCCFLPVLSVAVYVCGQVLTPVLRCLGNVICSGLDETASAACEKKALFPALGRLLVSEHQHVRKECLWVLSNVTGTLTNSCV